MIDAYTEGVIEKIEFEPRVKNYKKKLFNVQEQLSQIEYNQTQFNEIQILIEKFETFSSNIKQKLETADWQIKRDIFETLIKKVEIGSEDIKIIFRISPYPLEHNSGSLLEDCTKGRNPYIPNFHGFSLWVTLTRSIFTHLTEVCLLTLFYRRLFKHIFNRFKISF